MVNNACVKLNPASILIQINLYTSAMFVLRSSSVLNYHRRAVYKALLVRPVVKRKNSILLPFLYIQCFHYTEEILVECMLLISKWPTTLVLSTSTQLCFSLSLQHKDLAYLLPPSLCMAFQFLSLKGVQPFLHINMMSTNGTLLQIHTLSPFLITRKQQQMTNMSI